MLLLNRVKVLVPLYLLAVGIPLWRREWRLATAAALCPVISIIGAKVLKVLFGRPWYGENLAYPSGHTTVAITVAAMLVLAIGIHPWSVTLAVIGAAIPSIGMASNGFHYFTDIIGGAFYATGMVCLAVLAAGPQALHHSQTRAPPTGEVEVFGGKPQPTARAAARPAARPEKMQPPRKVPSSAR